MYNKNKFNQLHWNNAGNDLFISEDSPVALNPEEAPSESMIKFRIIYSQ